MTDVSTFRLYLMRATYLMILVFLTTSIWPLIIHHVKPWTLMHGVACCMLAAMAPLMGLGIRSPLQMLPILLYELFWKSIWLLAVALPLWLAHQIDPDTAESVKACLFGVIIVPLVIPWPYVFANYVKKPGERWK